MSQSRTITNCPVCVVGGAGFLGSHLVAHLINDRNCDVLVVDNLITGRKGFLHQKAKFEWADITGPEPYLLKLFKHHQIQYVFNYAAEPYIPVSFARPLHVFDINAMGALKVINAAQEAGCKGILQVSSAEIYGDCGTYSSSDIDRTPRKIKETDEVCPHSTYGAAKAAIDAMVQVRYKEAGTPCIALRQFNCVGERETHPYIVPEIINQLYPQKGNPKGEVKLGNNSFRDFLYAGDAVRMATELLEKGQFGEVYNLGSESGIQMYDLAQLIGIVMGFKLIYVEKDPARVRPWEIWNLLSDNSKINRVISYRPKVDLKEALYKTVEYFLAMGGSWGF